MIEQVNVVAAVYLALLTSLPLFMNFLLTSLPLFMNFDY